ncbi:MAG: TIGR02147 family protein [Proteobacteria bacterium]|nr:MAG: TIGR02147 family protein [Pseudomonadota bacterium]
MTCMNRENEKIQILKSEFSARSKRNPRYSIRAFAKYLGVSHTTLSLIMAGKRPLSQKACLQIADRLGLDPVRAKVLKGPYAASDSVKKKQKASFELVDLETFAFISDWLHYAILSLIDIDPKNLDSHHCAKRLGVSEPYARISLDRLKKLGLIETKGGVTLATGKQIRVDNSVTTAAAKKFQQQLLEKALVSLNESSFEEHDFSSMTIAIDPELIPYAREKIRTFRRQLTADLESRGTPTEVYNLTVQIYPVSKKVENEKK